MAYSLPGTNGSPAARPVVALLVVATALFCCMAGALFLAGNHSAPTSPAPTSLSPSSIASPAEHRRPSDVAFHLNNVKAHTDTAIEQINRTQQILGALTPELGRNLLWTEQRRAETAIMACETAKQAASQALVELRQALSQKE